MGRQILHKQTYSSLAILLVAVAVFFIASFRGPLYAGFWDKINENLLLMRLVGIGQFIGYQRNVDTKDPLFPIEVVSDGFKMIRVYQDLRGDYLVEWSWRVLLKNKSSRALGITLEYKLQDEDDFLVAASKESLPKIEAGETVALEKTDYLLYDTAKRVVNSNWYVHLQN